MSSFIELPTGWTWARLGDIADATLGKTPRRGDYRSKGLHRLVKYRDLQSGQIDFSVTKDAYVLDDPLVLKGLRELRPRDVLIGASGHDGSTVGKKLAIVDQLPDDEQVFFVGELFRIRPRNNNFDSRWFLHYFSSTDGYQSLQKAVTGGHLTNGRARQIVIPAAPPEEQRVITDILDIIRQHERASSVHLAASRHAIERFRHAVLAAAYTGRLTADWRRTIGPADGSVIETAERTNLPSIPTTWEYRRLDEVAAPGTAISYGIVLPGPEVANGVPYVRQQDVAGGTVLVDQLRHTTPEIAAKHERSSLRQGDVLLCIIRNLRVAVVPPGIDGANITQGMVRIRPGSGVVGQYLAAYLEGPHAQRWMKDQYIGLAMPRINVADARAIPIPLPPLSEQVEIMSRLNSLLGFADTLQRRLTVAADHVDRSSRAVLAKAFRGELSTEAEQAASGELAGDRARS